MPCWYFEKKEIRNTPSIQDGLDHATEARYRREGARFIIDAGTKMGLRYDTCATGVVYFHRFYMFHSFKEFHRYITAACCLFLAGKVEETPKKCKDIIKVCQALLSPQLFTVFGEDPKEEVMTMERILLQTIKFDLQVEHPYGILLKFAKVVKGDKEKIQKLVQMAWTFINDSLCTCLCLLWEPEIISVSLMYLATRLTKFDIQDWHGRAPGTRIKWWDFLVEDITVELMEDICHKVLDLYSSNPQSQLREDSPPTTPIKKSEVRDTPPPPPPNKRSNTTTPVEGLPEKAVKKERKSDAHHPPALDSRPPKHSSSSKRTPSLDSGPPVSKTSTVSVSKPPHTTAPSSAPLNTKPEFSTFNPYMASHMFSSSFMSQEGSKSIQNLMGGGGGGGGTAGNPAPAPEKYPPPQTSVAPPTGPGGQYPPPAGQYPPSQYTQPSVYAPTANAPYSQPPPAGTSYTVPPHGAYPPPATAATAPAQSYNVPITNPQNYPQGSYPPNYQPTPYQYNSQPQQPQTGAYQQNMAYTPQTQPSAPQQYPQQPVLNPRIPLSGAPVPPRMPMPNQQNQARTPNPSSSGGLTVRISGRR
ncbi:cyclin-K-like isoform X1 [Ostrea edulis]|nr:cyclin-K-like isoform X1 [Ostrea edulis]